MAVTASPRSKPFLEAEYCKGCLRCVDACPKDCISQGDHIHSGTGYVPVELDLTKCNGCQLCRLKCPVEAIEGAKKVVHTIIQEKCIKCGTCQQVCPADAVRVS